MNYRHLYHAGNAADVFKHVVLRLLLGALVRKDKPLLYLDTHAGRGGYDLDTTTRLPDGREREAEWPQGIGRLWYAQGLEAPLAGYVAAVRAYNQAKGGNEDLQFYPGSPVLAQALLRPQDRTVLCELREDDSEALAMETGRWLNTTVRTMDGYTALRALLPPPERRACVLIDPPFESANEFADIRDALREALRRFPTGTYAVWYPVTERARSERFLMELRDLAASPALLTPVPALVTELQLAADTSPVRMKGCGLLVLNPPWKIDVELRPLLPVLAGRLGLDAGAFARIEWLVPES